MPTKNSFDHLSDSDLDDMVRAVASKGTQAPASDLSSMSDDDLDKMVLAKAKSPQASIAQTALEHGGNAAAMGYLPQLQAGAETESNAISNFGDKALQAVGLDRFTSQDAQLRKQGFTVPEETYTSARDAGINRLKQEAQANPKTALAADIGGGVVGGIATPIPGMGSGKGILGAVRAGAVGGAVQGLAQNPGDVEGKVSPIQASERLDNAKSGALVGGATGLGTAVTSKALGALSRAPETLKTLANDSAVNASGAMLKDFRQMEGSARAQKLGQYLRDNKIVQAGDTFDDVAKKAGAARTAAGKDLDSLYQKAVAKFKEGPGETPLFNNGFSPERDKEAILAQVSKEMGNQEGKQSALDRLGKYFDQLAKDHALTDADGKIIPGGKVLDPRTTQDVKTEMDKAINYARNPLTKEPAAESAFKEARDIISKKIDSEISRLGGADDVKALKAANESYGLAKQAENMAADKANRISANNRMGFTDTVAGGAGLAAGTAAGSLLGGDYQHAGEGAIAGGLLAAGANHYGRKYGSGLISGAAGAASPVAKYSGIPLAAGKAGLLLQNPGLMGRLAVENKKLKEDRP